MNCTYNRHIRFFVSFFFLLGLLSITGCVDLSGAKYRSAQEAKNHSDVPTKAQIKKRKLYHGEVHAMLGGLGVFSTGMKELRDSVSKEYAIPARSDMWYNAGHVADAIKTHYYTHKTRRPVILVGHSLGANEQIKVARNLNKAGIPVDLLVTVDAVSQTRVPPNVKHALNFYKSGYVPMFSGLRLRAVDPQKTRVDNIDVTKLKGVAVNHFTIDKDPVVQAMIMDEVKKVISNANRAKA